MACITDEDFMRLEAENARLKAQLAIAREAILAHQAHIERGQKDCVKYLVPAVDKINIGKDAFVARMIYHFDGPEQRAAQKLAAQALAQMEQADGRE